MDGKKRVWTDFDEEEVVSGELFFTLTLCMLYCTDTDMGHLDDDDENDDNDADDDDDDDASADLAVVEQRKVVVSATAKKARAASERAARRLRREQARQRLVGFEIEEPSDDELNEQLKRASAAAAAPTPARARARRAAPARRKRSEQAKSHVVGRRGRKRQRRAAANAARVRLAAMRSETMTSQSPIVTPALASGANRSPSAPPARERVTRGSAAPSSRLKQSTTKARRSAVSTRAKTVRDVGRSGASEPQSSIAARLAHIGKVVDVGGGGDCMLHAFLDQIFSRSIDVVDPDDGETLVQRSQLTFSELRRRLHDWLLAYPNTFAPFIVGARDRYVDFVRQTGVEHEYLSNVHLTALATMFNVTVFVHNSRGAAHDRIVTPLVIDRRDSSALPAAHSVAIFCSAPNIGVERANERALHLVFWDDPVSDCAHYQSVQPGKC